MTEIIENVLSLWGSVTVLAVITLMLLANRWIFNKITQAKGTVTKQIVSVIIVLIGALAFTIALPLESSIKEQIISLIGIVLSAAFALSSTTIIGNALAGIMNNSIRNFKLGNFIRVETNFGRITKKGLFRTEIQNEDRSFTTLPNLYLSIHPIKILRDSGTIISTNVSLGYDLNSSEIQKVLKEAAVNCGLKDPFVYIESLGDYSVNYKINGLLEDLDKYFTTYSKLHSEMLNSLHKNGVEIVSPTFMNQRQVNDKEFIPRIDRSKKEKAPKAAEKLPEETVFDKAMEADKIDEKQKYIDKIDKEIKELRGGLDGAENKDKAKDRIKTLEERKEVIKESIKKKKKELDEND